MSSISRCSEQAFAHALLLAEQHEATLQLFHAIVLHSDDLADPDAHFPGNRELMARMFEVADSELASLTELHKGSPVAIEEYRDRGVSAADLILEHAREHDVDLIVMGTHGRRGPARFFLGSVASEIVAFAKESCSDLIVTASHGLTGLERLLVGSTSEQVVTNSGVPVLLVKSFGKQILPPETAGTTSLAYREDSPSVARSKPGQPSTGKAG